MDYHKQKSIAEMGLGAGSEIAKLTAKSIDNNTAINITNSVSKAVTNSDFGKMGAGAVVALVAYAPVVAPLAAGAAVAYGVFKFFKWMGEQS